MIASKKMRTKADIAFNLCNTILMIFILICTVGIILVGYGFNLFQTILL